MILYRVRDGDIEPPVWYPSRRRAIAVARYRTEVGVVERHVTNRITKELLCDALNGLSFSVATIIYRKGARE